MDRLTEDQVTIMAIVGLTVCAGCAIAAIATLKACESAVEYRHPMPEALVCTADGGARVAFLHDGDGNWYYPANPVIADYRVYCPSNWSPPVVDCVPVVDSQASTDTGTSATPRPVYGVLTCEAL